MKKIISVLVMLGVFGTTSSSFAEKIMGGPKGGRLLETESTRAEFFVEKDHTVSITFYDSEMKKISAGLQFVSVIAEAPGGKTKLEFEKRGDELVSTTSLPKGHGYNIVVQIKDTPEAKPKNFRIPLETAMCGDCKRAEYACTCEGH